MSDEILLPDGFESITVTANGTRLHAVVGGSGAPVLLLHGWPQTWRARLHSHLVAPGSPDPAADLHGAITTALDAIQIDPAGVKAHEALTATYISAPRTHRAAARRLGVPYGTYRRHLALAKERLTEQLLRQPATTPTPAPPHQLPRE